jgi:hypothetical protein
MENAEITTKKTFSLADLFNKWWHLLGTMLSIIYFLIMAHVQLNNVSEDTKTLKEDSKFFKDKLNTIEKKYELLEQKVDFVEKIDNKIYNELEELRKR